MRALIAIFLLSFALVSCGPKGSDGGGSNGGPNNGPIQNAGCLQQNANIEASIPNSLSELAARVGESAQECGNSEAEVKAYVGRLIETIEYLPLEEE